jgi:VWFA-related protein
MTRLRFAVLAIVASPPLLVAQSASPRQLQAQEPIATFRSGVRAIQVDAVVTDKDGNPVRGLTEDDFEIIEKGKPQAITTFEAVDIPIERQPPDLADADVVTNEGDGRIYLIVLDNVSTEHGMYAKRILRRFFEDHFGPSDVAAVMLLDRGHANSGQDFTSNRRLLIKGIDSFIGYNGGESDAEKVPPGSASPFTIEAPGASGIPKSEAALLGAVNRMGRLKDLTEFLIKTPGRRKAMLLVSEAIGFDATDFKDYRGTAMKPAGQLAHAAMTAATRGNIAIYPIHPGGPGAAGLAETMELRTLADATGGFAVVNSNEFDAGFTRLVEENSVYYMLGFNSSQEKDDGLYVPVTVRVKRPGLRVHAREGYVAPFKGKDTVVPVERRPGVESAVASPVPIGGIPLRAVAAAFKGKGKKAAIAVSMETDPQALGLVEGPNGALRGSVDVRLVVTDVHAKRVPQIRPQAGKIALPARAPGDAKRQGLRILTKTDLEPGRYQLRIAVGTAQRGGSVNYDLDVPDFSKKELSMSGLVLRGPGKPEGVFLPAGDPLEALAPRGPTTTRVFTKDDMVSAYAEVYEASDDRTHNIAVLAVLRSEAGQETPVASAVFSSEDLKKAGDVLKIEPQLPLAKLAPGRYALSLEAKSGAGGDPVVRTVPFRVK